ncbi:MAG TPA: hypothetical protein VK988_09760 [Acidimicrobiales bacterium]|nr:hypothetical protein [Acidimicrobiales bacterium]
MKSAALVVATTASEIARALLVNDVGIEDAVTGVVTTAPSLSPDQAARLQAAGLLGPSTQEAAPGVGRLLDSQSAGGLEGGRHGDDTP